MAFCPHGLQSYVVVRNPRIQLLLPDLERQVASHQIPAATAAQQLLRCLP